MSGVVTDSGEPLDESGHPRQGPQSGAKTVGWRSLPQRLVEQLALALVEFRFAARPPGASEPARLIALPCHVPAADALAAGAELAGNLSLSHLPGGEQARGAPAALGQGGEISPRSRGAGHACILPPGHSCCHYILRDSVIRPTLKHRTCTLFWESPTTEAQVELEGQGGVVRRDSTRV